jgi:dienelactone hydrolase
VAVPLAVQTTYSLTDYIMHKSIICLALLLTPLAMSRADDSPTTSGPPSDPLAPILKSHLQPTVAILLDHYRTQRKYVNSDFPLSRGNFSTFQAEIKTELARALGITDWVVRSPAGKASPIANHFEDRLIKTISLHGVTVEVHAVTLQPTGLVVPMAICLPSSNKARPVPGVCVFSGHTPHGLHDLVVNLDSYQQGVAVRLAQAGIASIAVEKIDTGYLSRNGTKGNDENAAATLMLSWGSILRSHQLRACLAATEILAGHARVDESRMGATGVSLGGWLTVQTAMLNDRLTAVADFGMKTRSVATGRNPNQYQGQRDLCHIIPGMLSLSDRNLMPVVLAPTPMLAGHGKTDAASQREHAANYRTICEAQYAALGAAKNYSYLIHAGGDTMPSREAIDWFTQRFVD